MPAIDAACVRSEPCERNEKMQANDQKPVAQLPEQEVKPVERKRALWSFAELGRKVGLGPNRTILGED